MINLNYRAFTDLDINTVLIGDYNRDVYKLRDNVKEVFIQGYGNGSFDIILVKELDNFNMQGCFFGKNVKAVITGFRIDHQANSVRIHFKSSGNAKSLFSAKKLYKSILVNCLELKVSYKIQKQARKLK